MNAVKGEEAEGRLCAELLQRVAVLGRVQVEGERRTGGHHRLVLPSVPAGHGVETERVRHQAAGTGWRGVRG